MFSPEQKSELAAPLDRAHVKSRKQAGRAVSYLEGWRAIDEANRIFGFDSWTRETVDLRLVAERERKIGQEPNQRDGWGVSYVAKVRIIVFAGDTLVTREGVGAGHGIDVDLGQAHESAIKEAECVPLSTRILTPTGFMSHDKVRPGDLVAAYNPSSHSLVWTALLAKATYDDAALVRVHNRRTLDVVCTPDHDWIVRASDGSVEKRRATEIRPSDSLILSAAAPSGDSSLSPQDAALLGVAICDGTPRFHKGRLMGWAIYQSKPTGLAYIEKQAAGRLGKYRRNVPEGRTFPTGRTYATLPAFYFSVSADLSRAWLRALGSDTIEDIPAAVSRLSFSAREAMLEGMLVADGQKGGRLFGKKKRPWVMETFRTLCALNGKTIGPIRSAAVPTQSIQAYGTVHGSRLLVEDAGRGAVWCPQTLLGTWVACFENGQPAITGNTDAMKRALMTFGNPFGLALYDKEQTNVADTNGHAPVQDSKVRFIAECLMRIGAFKEEKKLIDWWGSEDQKKARADFSLTQGDVDALKAAVIKRKSELHAPILAAG